MLSPRSAPSAIPEPLKARVRKLENKLEEAVDDIEQADIRAIRTAREERDLAWDAVTRQNTSLKSEIKDYKERMYDGVSRMFDASDKLSLAYDLFWAFTSRVEQIPADIADRVRAWVSMPRWQPLFMCNGR